MRLPQSGLKWCYKQDAWQLPFPSWRTTLQARKILAGWIGQAAGFSAGRGVGRCGERAGGLPEQKPDVVLMDINLPGMNGVEAVRRLKPALPATQFVMLTVYEDADHIFNALAAGATGYLLKQTPRAELLAALEDVHGGGSPMTSNIARKVVQSFQQVRAPVPQPAKPSRRASRRSWICWPRAISTRKSPNASISACPRSIPTSAASTKSSTSARAPRRWLSMPGWMNPGPIPRQPRHAEGRSANNPVRRGRPCHLF